MNVPSFVDVHIDDFLLVRINVLSPFPHAILIVPTGGVHTRRVTFYFMTKADQGVVIELVLYNDRGYVEGEFAVHVSEGPGHLSNVLEDNVMSVGRGREQRESSEQ